MGRYLVYILIVARERFANEIVISDTWETIGYPGYLGKKKDEWVANNNKTYGEGNWRLTWELKNGKVLNFGQVFAIYIQGYKEYFENHQDEAEYITDNYAYGYDKDDITKDQAYDLIYLFEKPGKPNQFHHVAFNLALTSLGYTFKGEKPLQVREGKPGTPESEQPEGWRWSPGYIPCPLAVWEQSTDIPCKGWWQQKSIEHFYQKKSLQIKVETVVVKGDPRQFTDEF